MQHGQRRRRLLIPLVALGLVVAAGVAGALYLKARRGGGPVAGQTGGAAPAGGSVAVASTETKPDAQKKTPIPVSVAPVGTGSVSSYITSTANLVSENEVKVLAEAEGRVAELLVEEGTRIARGQVLAALAREDAEIALTKARVKADSARLARQRGEKALAEELLSRESFDKVKLEDEIAQQEQAEAKWRLEKTTIRSPFGGRVTERSVQLGQHVRPGDVLFTVADFDPLIARIYLPEKDIFGLEEGREVRITLKANEATQFGGRIRQISPVVDTATGTVKVTIEASAPPPEVRPGAFVTIDIVRETHPRALLLPREAVIRELQEAYVFVAKGEVAERRAVSLGLEEGGRVEVLSGVTTGEDVIVAGQGGLKDGSPIKIIPPNATTELGIAIREPVRG